jgi:hypothetical protein
MSSSTRSRLARPLVVLALLGSLVACGDNTDFSRGPTNCDSSGQNANNDADASCEETGPNPGQRRADDRRREPRRLSTTSGPAAGTGPPGGVA